MIELALILGKHLDRKFLISEMEKAINVYKLNPTEDSENKVGHMALLLFTSFITEGRDVNEMLKDIETSKLINERMKAKS